MASRRCWTGPSTAIGCRCHREAFGPNCLLQTEVNNILVFQINTGSNDAANCLESGHRFVGQLVGLHSVQPELRAAFICAALTEACSEVSCKCSVFKILSIYVIMFGRTLGMFCVGVLFIKTTTCLIGMAMYSYYQDCDPVRAGVRRE